MSYNQQKEPLYRKVNTKARMCHHRFGGDFKHDRNTKLEQQATDEGVVHRSMHSKVKRGLDYTPLFRFLLSKVGQDWTAVCKEAESRLDKRDPIFWMVALREEDKHDIVRLGEMSYYSGLFVDENNVLQKVNPDVGPDKVTPWCTCCTYTLNGKPIVFHIKPRETVELEQLI